MKKALEVYLPYQKTLITQRFGANANYSYARDGLKGHTAYDWGASWGAPIPNCTADAYCYSLMNKNNPDPGAFRAIFMLVETETGIYEVSYGHISRMDAVVGQIYQVGDVIGLVGNTGDVFVGNHEVTREERLAGSHAGAHLHGPQIRPVKKVKKRSGSKTYLKTDTGYLKAADGSYYEVINYGNGYNGCVSLAPYSTEILATTYKAQAAQDADRKAKADAMTQIAHDIETQIPTLPEPARSQTQNALQRLFQAIRDFLAGKSLF